MKKILVAYFSASGITADVASKLAKVAKADLFEIKPEIPYTKEDLDWMDKQSRSSVEMADKAFRPAIGEKISNMEEYAVLYIGFPIWWHVAPTIINTFLESYDLNGKEIILFATSGGSGFGKTVEELEASCPGARIKEGKLFHPAVSEGALETFIESTK